MENFHAICHARTMFYPGDAYPFLEAVLSIPEKLRGFARKMPGRRSATSTHVQQWPSADDGTGPGGSRAAEF